MEFHHYIPSFPLSQFVENFIYYKGYDPEHNFERFLPDGNAYLVIDLTESPKAIYDNFTLKEIQHCRKVWFSGIRTKFITIPSGRENEMFVITFQKGRCYPFVDIPMNELTDYTVDGELVLSTEILNMRDALLGITLPQQRFLHAEEYLVRTFSKKLILNPVIEFSINRIIQSPDQLSINFLTSKVGYSQKHFIKLFKDYVGLSPKSFLKVIRFQKAIQEIETTQKANWARIAIECGFFDQAHFINDFKAFSGYTPNEYLQTKTSYANYVAVE